MKNAKYALRAAARRGHVEEVSELLRAGCEVTGLAEAAAGGHVAVARLLLSADQCKSACESARELRKRRGNAVVKAAGAGHREMVAFLLQGCDAYDHLDKALYKASVRGHASVVRLLLFAGAKPKEALHESLKFGHVDVARMLVPFSSREARTAVLDAAVLWGHEELVCALLAEGVFGLHNDTFVRALIVGQLTTARLLLEGPSGLTRGEGPDGLKRVGKKMKGGVVWLRGIERRVLYAAAPRVLWSAFERLGAMPPRGHERHRSYVRRVWWTMLQSLLEVRELQRAWRHKYYSPSGAGGRAAVVRALNTKLLGDISYTLVRTRQHEESRTCRWV